MPLPEVAAQLAARFPALFGAEPKPVKLRVQGDIQQRAPGVFTRQALSAFLHRHTTSSRYLAALAQASQRFDLDGAPAGELAAEHRDAAAAELERRRERRRERIAAGDAPPRRERPADGRAAADGGTAADRPPRGERPPRAPRDTHEAHAARGPQPPRPRGAAADATAAAATADAAPDTAERAERRARAQLLRDFETTTLTPANFCALKGVKPEQLEAVLVQARAEKAEWLAQRPPRPPQEAGERDARFERRGPFDARTDRPVRPERSDRRPSVPFGDRPPRAERGDRTDARPDARADARGPRRDGDAPRSAAPRGPGTGGVPPSREPRPPREPREPRPPRPAASDAATGAAPPEPGAPAAPALPIAKGVTVRADALRAFVEAVVARGGSQPREAGMVAANLVEANLTGHDSHGVGMLPRYILNLKAGGLKPNQTLRLVVDRGPLLSADGNLGYGQVIGHDAMALAIERARVHGIAVMGLHNSHHIGRIGAWAEQCLDAGMVSVHFVNVVSEPIVAPHGGREARFGTNPMCVGLPVAGREPIVLDFATSRLAMGKVRVAFNKGVAVPPGVLIDVDGQPTTDPATMFREPHGALLPFGDYKGYGLAIACEILGGALSGGRTLRDNWSPTSIVNNMTSFVIDPARAGVAEHLSAEARAFADSVLSAPAARGQRVQLPGDPERFFRRKRSAEGIRIDAATWAQLLETAASVGLGAEEAHALAQPF